MRVASLAILGYALNSFKAKKKKNNIICAEQKGEKEASELTKLLEEDDIPKTPLEFSEYMQKREKNSLLPPLFSNIMMPVKMLTTSDLISGLKVEASAQISNSLQIGGSWNFSKEGSSFSLTSVLAQDAQSSETSFISCKQSNSGNKKEIQGNLKLGTNSSIRTEIYFPNHNMMESNQAFEFTHTFSDSLFTLKYSSSIYTFGFMQTLIKNLCLGFEVSTTPFAKKSFWAFGGRYLGEKHSIYANYNPINPMEPLSIGYVFSPHKKLSLFAQFEEGMHGATETICGWKFVFTNGIVKGYLTTNGKACSAFTHFIDNLINFSIHGIVDFTKVSNNTNFGVSVSLGG